MNVTQMSQVKKKIDYFERPKLFIKITDLPRKPAILSCIFNKSGNKAL